MPILAQTTFARELKSSYIIQKVFQALLYSAYKNIHIGSLEYNAKRPEGITVDLASGTNNLLGDSTYGLYIQFGNLYSKAFEQGMEMGNSDHRLSVRDRNFIIFTETSGVVELGASTFHYPAPRKFLPLVRLKVFIAVS